VTGPAADAAPTSNVFELAGDEFEDVHFLHEPAVGLCAIVAVHSTTLGPALGGTRFRPYGSEGEALLDVLRLARGMTYKQAAAGLAFGGGKAVILGDPRTERTDDLIRAYGRHLDRLGGVYLTAEDVGTTQTDMDLLRNLTPYVTGTSVEMGGSGDPSPATAWGVFHAMRAAAAHRWGSEDLAGRHVVVSGVGKVGRSLVDHLVNVGATVSIADPWPDAVAAVREAHPGVVVLAPDEALDAECDVLAPCAFGAVLSEATIPALRCEVVCGAANNQLATDDDGERLTAREVLYVPDYVANAGGVINLAEEVGGYDRDRAFRHVEQIHDTVAEVLRLATERGITTAAAADALAEARIAQGRVAQAPNAH
jgi:valine dehydrogenase (NAD+)